MSNLAIQSVPHIEDGAGLMTMSRAQYSSMDDNI